VDDFQFSQSDRMLHLYNVPSPAATASIAVGRAVVEMAAKAWGWGEMLVASRQSLVVS